MTIESKLLSLVSQWSDRAANTGNSLDYKCAVSECIYDIQCLLSESMDYQEYLQSKIESLPSEEIKDYLLSQEADEHIA